MTTNSPATSRFEDLKRLHELEVLLGDALDRDVVNIDLIFLMR